MSGTKSGDLVKIHYTGRLEDGTVFDSSEGRSPLAFTAGGNEVILGVSRAVIDMEPGDKKTVEVAPEDGFGIRQPNQSQKVPRNLLPEDVKVGSALQAQGTEGTQPITVWVVELDEESAVLDANHPLAGRNLVFDIELVSVDTA
jgi:peptidylprolyl isomerase